MDNDPNSKPLWTVTGYHDTTEFDNERGVMPMVHVDFRMHDGTDSHVLVPRKDFDPDAVADMINTHAHKIAALKASQGPPVPMQSPYLMPTDDINSTGYSQ